MEAFNYFGSPSTDHPVPERPLGEQYRLALAENEARALREKDEAARHYEDVLMKDLSTWFNSVARDMKGKLAELTATARRGENTDSRITFSTLLPQDELDIIKRRDVEKLPGFKDARETARKLNVDFAFLIKEKESGSLGTINVVVDAAKSFNPRVTPFR